MNAGSDKQRLLLWLAVPVMAAVLVVLAIVQYRWSGQVSDATRAQMQASLQSSLMGFRMDMARELGAMCLELKAAITPQGVDGPRLAAQARHWRETASHPSLLAGVYLAGNTGPLLRLDETTGKLEPTAWPPYLEPLQGKLSDVVARRDEFALNHPPHPERPGRPGHGNFEPPWMVEQSEAALVRPIRGFASGNGGPTWMIVKLNQKVLEQEILPDLAQKYFGNSAGQNYRYAVRYKVNGNERVLYTSAAGFGTNSDGPFDAALALFGPPMNSSMADHPGVNFPAAGPGMMGHAQEHHGPEHMVRLDPVRYGEDDGPWEIVVKHQSGSLDAAVASLRRHHLVLSFSVLLLLAATMGLVLIASQRAHRLAKLQMEFVAGVSHELRTPLAVISSAAENMAHGVISDKEQINRYSNSILKQTRNLKQLVEQVLVFATLQQSKRDYQLQPVGPSEIIDTALENMAPEISAAGVTVERAIDPGLPKIKADPSALLRSLQNLVSNAVKYGGSSRWLRISARAVSWRGSATHVEITVQDRGPGMAGEELKHIFDPFYRSPAVASSNVHGAGLGLPLAKAAVEGMGGRLAVSSERGNGSSFTITLPVIAQARSVTLEEPLPGGVADD